MDVFNCPNCNSLFVMTKFRDVCDAYIKKKKPNMIKCMLYSQETNRTASMMQVVMETGELKKG